MKDTEPKEIKEVRDYQRRLIGKISLYLGIAVLVIGLVVGLVQRVSLTLLRIKCFETSGLTSQSEKGDAIVVTNKMIREALNNPPIDKKRFAEGYIPGYLIGNYYPLFTTNFSINKPLILTNFFSKGDIGFVKKGSKSDTLEIEIYRHSFDFYSTGNPDIEINSNQLDTIDDFKIVYFPEKYVIINQIDTIKLYSAEEMNKAIYDLYKERIK